MAGIAARRNNNYRDLILQNGLMQNHTLGGGNEKTAFYLSAGFFQDKGISKGLDYRAVILYEPISSLDQ